MPTYEYNCHSCGKFEVFHGIGDNPVEKCPACGKDVKRVISGGGGFIMKGKSGSSCCESGNSCASAGSCAMRNNCGM